MKPERRELKHSHALYEFSVSWTLHRDETKGFVEYFVHIRAHIFAHSYFAAFSKIQDLRRNPASLTLITLTRVSLIIIINIHTYIHTYN